MSGFTGSPNGPVLVRDTTTTTPFSTLLFSDTLGYNESISVTLSFVPYTNNYYGPAPAGLGTLSDPLGGGTFNAMTDTFTAVATVVGMPTPASQILDRLVYTPPAVADGVAPAITASVRVTSVDPVTGRTITTFAPTEILQIVTPPAITGTVSSQPVASGGQLDPFASVQVSDGNYGSIPALDETITITDSGVATDADGLLTGNGLSKTGTGTYVLSGYNSYRLSSLVFSTTQGSGTRTAVLSLAATDSSTGYTSTDSGTTVQIIGQTTTGGGGNPPHLIILPAGDQTYSAVSSDTVLAGSGNDTITANSGHVSVIAGSGLLSFIGGTSPSSVTGGAGSSTILGGSGGGYYTGGRAGFNVLVSQGASGANTTLTGSGAGDQVFGSDSGNDLLVAGSGRDSILGGGGNTTIQGGATASVIFTGSGASLVYGGTAGGDTIVGGSGALDVQAQGGDAIFGNAGALSVTASKIGADSIVGGAGALSVNGQGANMLVVAGTTTSNIQIGNGASLVFAGSGSNSVTGGAGSLQIVLGSGSTNTREGSGPAVYDVVRGAAGGTDVINGFKPGSDKIELFGYQPDEQQVTSAGGSSLISLADGTKIQIVGVTGLGNSIVG